MDRPFVIMTVCTQITKGFYDFKYQVQIVLVVQMKFGEICKKLQPSGDINAFMVKKQLMSSIFGKFFWSKFIMNQVQ